MTAMVVLMRLPLDEKLKVDISPDTGNEGICSRY